MLKPGRASSSLRRPSKLDLLIPAHRLGVIGCRVYFEVKIRARMNHIHNKRSRRRLDIKSSPRLAFLTLMPSQVLSLSGQLASRPAEHILIPWYKMQMQV